MGSIRCMTNRLRLPADPFGRANMADHVQPTNHSDRRRRADSDLWWNDPCTWTEFSHRAPGERAAGLGRAECEAHPIGYADADAEAAPPTRAASPGNAEAAASRANEAAGSHRQTARGDGVVLQHASARLRAAQRRD